MVAFEREHMNPMTLGVLSRNYIIVDTTIHTPSDALLSDIVFIYCPWPNI